MTDEVNRIRPAFRATMSLATHLAMLIVDATIRSMIHSSCARSVSMNGPPTPMSDHDGIEAVAKELPGQLVADAGGGAGDEGDRVAVGCRDQQLTYYVPPGAGRS